MIGGQGTSEPVLKAAERIITLWPFIFVRPNVEITRRLALHEKIHLRQQVEMLLLGFYAWYFIEWLIRLWIDYETAYRQISFEQEAHSNDSDDYYLKTRKPYNWIKFL